ncbi:S-adenosyl-L-methionine-dependent methyltransferase [Martensiomyces pterosporus]|nr:S-adenosyl-L-methionine-dependent methyltransferase [Martensiomyces pterosporus]
MVVNEIEKGSQGLVVLVKNQMMHGAFLQQIRNGGVAFRFCAVCHGKVDQKAAAANADLFDQWLLYNNLPADIFDHVHIHSSSATRSSGAGHLSMIQATVGRAAHGGLVLRRFMHEVGHPVVGGQKYAQPLANHRDKGNLLALIGVEFASTADPAQKVCISTAAPSKLASVCEREAKFYERRQKKALEEMDRLSREGLVDGKPVAYIAGLKEFCGHTFRVSTDTLIPRPSTETLVDVAVRFLNRVGNKTHQPPRVMDLGTGSGCILLSVLLEIPKARGVGIDISQPALDIAEANCKLHGLNERATMLRGSFESFTSDAAVLANGPFDFIACNPPYISTTKATRMANTVGHEPSLALVAEDGGYQAYRDIHSSLSANLSVLGQAGCIGFEIGKGMERGVRNIFKDWVEAGSFADDHGFLRVLVFQKPPSL